MLYATKILRHYLAGVAALSMLLALIGSGAVQAQEPSRTFSETSKTVSGRFLKYWNEHGGLAQQGYPISEEIQERSDMDGKMYTVQYFQRAVFEYHPEFAPPNDVLLSLLGYMLYRQKYSGAEGAPHQNNNRPQGALYFPETRKWISGGFRVYWERHGGLAQQGYPISNEFLEVSKTDGKQYMVQYFQRAVFEYHPEFKGTSNEVLLSLLGTFHYEHKYPDGGPAQATASPIKQPTYTKTPGTPVKPATATRTSAVPTTKPSNTPIIPTAPPTDIPIIPTVPPTDTPIIPTARPTDTPIPPPTNPLGPGGRILSGQSIFSSNRSYALTMQPDGNLVVAGAGSNDTIWAAGTTGNAGASATMLENGNFAILAATGSPIWTSGTNIPGSRLILQDTGALEILAPDGNVVYEKPDYKSGEPVVRGPYQECDPNDPNNCHIVQGVSTTIQLGKALTMRVRVQHRGGSRSVITLRNKVHPSIKVVYTIKADDPDHIFEASSNTRDGWELSIGDPGWNNQVRVSYRILPGTRW